jgi:C4-dicarboxylate-specific signal transduction histidine kinase
MEAVASRPITFFSKRRMIGMLVVALSCALTAMMSLIFHHRIRPDMMATGLVAAIIINHVVDRMTRSYRQQLREAHDLLEQRVRERTAELERTREELMVRDRMATAGMVAAAVSHEIRSPLGVIRIAVDEVKEMIVAPPEAIEYVRDISDAADRITTILKDLSSIARPVDDPLGPMDLAAALDSASRLASYRFGNGVTLERDRRDVPAVIGNTSRVIQLVTNLLHNAARAKRADAINTIRIATETRDDTVVLHISDTGTGMTEETKRRLFEPFYTTGGLTGGTGLGLTICRSLVERMGGTIAIESVHGAGTTVSVTLRRA